MLSLACCELATAVFYGEVQDRTETAKAVAKLHQEALCEAQPVSAAEHAAISEVMDDAISAIIRLKSKSTAGRSSG